MSSFSSRPVYTRQLRGEKKQNFFQKITIIVLLIVGIFVYLVWNVGNATIPAKKYTISRGYTASVLNEKLGFGIANWRYSFWLRFFGPENIDIRTGTYETKTPVSIQDFLTKTIKTPIYKDQTIMILPGWNIYDIDSYLFSEGVGGAGELIDTARINFKTYQEDFPFLKGATSLEGFLYPDTYRIREDGGVDAAIRVMLREFGKKIGPDYNKMDTKKAYETLILASIVEREERNDTNQPIVAGILSKRVKEGIALGADATVCYGYAKTQKQCTPSFIGSVIRDKNPYNTRSMRGYTPTPISNVPLSSWKAANNPESSPYYYYLHDNDGYIHYGKTNEEHIANKQKYLR